jgi:hypothetical protein
MFKTIRRLSKNKKWVWIAEVIAAMTVFTIIFWSILWSIATNDTSFQLKQREGNMAAAYWEVFWYLYTYKKNLWTSLFKSITIGNSTCTETINATDTNPGQWCVLYPYYSGTNIVFWTGTLATTSVTNWTQTYFTNNVLNWNGKWYMSNNKIPGNKQIILFIRQDTSDEDLFHLRFRMLDTSDIWLTPSKVYNNFDQSFDIY